MTNPMGDTSAERISASLDAPTVVELFERLDKVMEELRPIFKATLETKKEDSRE